MCNTTTPPVAGAHPDDDVTDAPPVRQPGTIDPPVGRALALLLVELVAPDVMYNGIPWPEEDFMKVTVERSVGRDCRLRTDCRRVCLFVVVLICPS